MILNINPNNYIKTISLVDNELNIVQENNTPNIQPSLTANLEPKQTLLNKEIIVQLQEVQDYSVLQISSKKETHDLNDTPSLEWLKGYCGDDRLYNQTVDALSNGCKGMKQFAEIVEKNKNSEIISHKDWHTINYYIDGFKNGYSSIKKTIDNSPYPKIVKFFYYIAPKTLQRLETLKQYLTTKTKEPEIEFELKTVDVKQNTDIVTINNSCEKTNDLLNFLVKDLEWYKWFLEDKKQPFISYSLQYFKLTRTINHIFTTNELSQSALY